MGNPDKYGTDPNEFFGKSDQEVRDVVRAHWHPPQMGLNDGMEAISAFKELLRRGFSETQANQFIGF